MESYITERYFYDTVILLVFTQTDINKFFLASRDFRNASGLAKSQRGG